MLLPVASGQKVDGAVSFHTDAGIFRCALGKGKEIAYKMKETRRVFVYVTGGGLNINGTKVDELSQAGIDLEKELKLAAERDSHFILIGIPSCKGWGYDEKTLKGEKA